MYQYYFFDLDGTLTDSQEGIINSIRYALAKYDITETDPAVLNAFIGPPLVNSFMKYYGFSETEAEQAVVYYREYFRQKGIFENRVYDGVPEVLKELKGRGKRLVVATSKPEEFTLKILKHFHLEDFFDVAVGATMDGTISHKKDVITHALIRAGNPEPKKVLMVGDREHDILGARENGLDSAGVLYGYGSKEELETAGANYIMETVEKLLLL